MEDKKKSRFPLALPDDLDAELREYAKGSPTRAPVKLNVLLVFLIRKGLEAAKQESAKGQPAAALWA